MVTLLHHGRREMRQRAHSTLKELLDILHIQPAFPNRAAARTLGCMREGESGYVIGQSHSEPSHPRCICSQSTRADWLSRHSRWLLQNTFERRAVYFRHGSLVRCVQLAVINVLVGWCQSVRLPAPPYLLRTHLLHTVLSSGSLLSLLSAVADDSRTSSCHKALSSSSLCVQHPTEGFLHRLRCRCRHHAMPHPWKSCMMV